MCAEKEAGQADPNEAIVEVACPLSIRQQNRNLILFGLNKSLTYFAAPVMYVGALDAILLNKLGYSDKVSNLPATAYLWTMAPFLVLFTWYFCRVQMIKPVVVASYAVIAATGLIACGSLLGPPSDWLVGALIVRAMILGSCLGIVIAALASARPRAGHLWSIHAGGRVFGSARVGYRPIAGGMARGRVRSVSDRGEDQAGSGREHARLAA